MQELKGILQEIRRRDEPLALATVVHTEGHAYRRAGSRMLVNAEGPVVGTVSGGCLTADLCARAQEVLATGLPVLLDYDLRGDLDLIWGSGSGCEGRSRILVERVDPRAPLWAELEALCSARRAFHLATVFDPDSQDFGRRWLSEEPLTRLPPDTLHEYLRPPQRLWIFGAGPEASCLLTLARGLGWSVGIADHRPALARAEAFPGALEVRSGPPRAVIPGLDLDALTACLLLSHTYQQDLAALELLLPSPAGYLGLMGHPERGSRLLQALRDEGHRFTEGQLARLFTPVGLDLGGRSPEAIALAILAEIQAHDACATGLPLRDRLGAQVRP